MQVNSPKFNTALPQPSFKGLNKSFVNCIDFADKFTSREASMFLYTGCIISRLVNSRDKYEFKETLIRDSLGWASLFFAAKMFEKSVGLAIEKVDQVFNKKSPKNENLFLTKEKRLPTILEALNPLEKKFDIKSFKDIQTLTDETLKKSLLKKKAVLYISSLAFSIGVIGIFIPWLNTVTTRKQKQRELETIKTTPGQQTTKQNPAMNDFLKLHNK